MINRSDTLPHLAYANDRQPAPSFPGASTFAPETTEADEIAAMRAVNRHARDEDEAARFAAMLGIGGAR